MTAVRGFARHMTGFDPATEIPPLGLVTYRQRWRSPFIYSEADVVDLMAAVPRLIPTPLRAATFQTMIGLLAATGMRVGEAIALVRSDIDWVDGVAIVRASKFNKSRELPLAPTTVDALTGYAALRDRLVPEPLGPSFFVSRKGTAVIYADFSKKFRELVRSSGVGGRLCAPPAHSRSQAFLRGQHIGPLASSRRGRGCPIAEAVDLPGPPNAGLHVLVSVGGPGACWRWLRLASRGGRDEPHRPRPCSCFSPSG